MTGLKDLGKGHNDDDSKTGTRTGTQVLAGAHRSDPVSFVSRIGNAALVTLATTVVVVSAVIAFLAFLWFSNERGYTWHRIMAEGYCTRAVAVSALLLRTAVDLQAGIAVAMLAALALDSSCVPLHQAPKISTMRASHPRPRALLLPAIQWVRQSCEQPAARICASAVVLLCATTLVLQLSSTILLSDLQLGDLPCLPVQSRILLDFNYSMTSDGFPMGLQDRALAWTRPPSAFPAFAEYSEPVSVPASVDDTGILLRALLPFADAQSRQMLRNYTGTALVLDCRVSCQPPELGTLSISGVRFIPSFTPFGHIVGAFQPSVTDIPKFWTPGQARQFNCTFQAFSSTVSLCQLNSPMVEHSPRNHPLPSKLQSEFKAGPARDAHRSGKSYLAIQAPSWTRYFNASIGSDNFTYHKRKHWTEIRTPHGTFSLSFCAAAWTGADLDVHMHGDQSRAEPISHWSLDSGWYTVPDVQRQLGNEATIDRTVESRSIMRLADKPSWSPASGIPTPLGCSTVMDWLTDMFQTSAVWRHHYYPRPSTRSAFLYHKKVDFHFAFYASDYTQYGIVISDPILVRQSHELKPSRLEGSANLLPFCIRYISSTRQVFLSSTTSIWTHSNPAQPNKALNNTGSLARAISTLVTTLSSMIYYEQMEAFMMETNAIRTAFRSVLYPQMHVGFAIVACACLCHTILVSCIAVCFVLYSQHTLLGNYWQSVAQVHSPDLRELIHDNTTASDKEIRAILERNAFLRVRLQHRFTDGQDTVQMTTIRCRRHSI